MMCKVKDEGRRLCSPARDHEREWVLYNKEVEVRRGWNGQSLSLSSLRSELIFKAGNERLSRKAMHFALGNLDERRFVRNHSLPKPVKLMHGDINSGFASAANTAIFKLSLRTVP